MNRVLFRKNLILILSFAFLIISMLGFSFLSKPVYEDTLNFNESDVLSNCPNYWISVKASENDFLNSDINSITFDDEDNALYLLFPKGADLSNVSLYIKDSVYNSNLAHLSLDLSEEIIYAGQKITAYTSEIPALYLSLDETDMSFNDMIGLNDKSNICKGDFVFDLPKDMAESKEVKPVISSAGNNKIVLSMRGSGYEFDTKKSFTIEFKKPTDLIGFGKFHKYNLIANNYDQTNLKNYIFFTMADRFKMEYTPKIENISLFVNGNYQGIYSLTTKVSQGKDKVAIKSGDYLINFGGRIPAQPVFYDSETYFCDSDFEEPYFDVIYPEQLDSTDEIKDIVQNFISSIENPANSSYVDYMDMESMAKYYLVQEISQNYDAFFRSTYAYYLKSDGKIHMGPIWDLDLTLGSNFDKNGIMFDTPDGFKVRQGSWYPRLFMRQDFNDYLVDLYNDEKMDEILFDMLDEFKSQESRLSIDGEMNYRLWRHIELPNILQQRRWTYKEYTDNVIDFFEKRINWINSEFKK